VFSSKLAGTSTKLAAFKLATFATGGVGVLVGSLSIPAATPSNDSTVSAGVLSGTLSIPAASVGVAATASPGVATGTFSLQPSTQTVDVTASPGVLQGTLSAQPSTVSAFVSIPVTFTDSVPNVFETALTQTTVVNSVDISLEINGVERKDHLKQSTLNIELELDTRGKAGFTLIDEALSYKPAVGEPVHIRNNGILLFHGTVQRVDSDIDPGGRILKAKVSCVDYSHDMDRRVVSGEFTDRTADAIVRALYNTYLVTRDNENMSGAGIETGAPTISGTMKVDNVSMRSALNQIAEASGWHWWVDQNRVLFFTDFQTKAAPFDITDGNRAFRNLRVTESRGRFRNRQLVRTAGEVSSTYSESFTGDGASRQFFTTQGVNEIVSITVDGSPQTFGRIVEDYFANGNQFDFYFDENDPGFRNFTPNPPPAFGAAIVINYKGTAKNIVVVEDSASITARSAVENNSGVYEAVADSRAAASQAAAEEYGTGLLRLYGSIPIEIEINTHEPGIFPGQNQTVNLTDYAINDSFLVETVKIKEVKKTFLDYTIHANNQSEAMRQRFPAFIEALAERALLPPDRSTFAQIPGSPTFENLEVIFNVPLDELTAGFDKTVHRKLLLGASGIFVPEEIHAHVTTAPVNGSLLVNVGYVDAADVDHGSILGTPLAVLSGTTDASAGASFSGFRILDQGYLYLDIEGIGADTPGGRLAVNVKGRWF
jgi:hypothetical protein